MLESYQPTACAIKLGLDTRFTCTHARRMPRMIQIRNVPYSLHRTLKARAAFAGMPLSDFLLAEIRRLAKRPTSAELRERLRHRSRVMAGKSAAAAVRCERNSW